MELSQTPAQNTDPKFKPGDGGKCAGKSPRFLKLLLRIFDVRPLVGLDLAIKYQSTDEDIQFYPCHITEFLESCERFGVVMDQNDIERFESLQDVARKVKIGQHIYYEEDELIPYGVDRKPNRPTGVQNCGQKVCTPTNPKTTYILRRFRSIHKPCYWLDRCYEEMTILRRLRHPNIVNAFGSFSCHGNQEVYILFPGYDMSLKSWLSSFIVPPKERHEKTANMFMRWILDLTSALTYFQGIGGMHRSIEPDNIYIKGDQVLLSGFSFYNTCESRNPEYRAPKEDAVSELDKLNNSRLGDVYSLGCVLLEFLATTFSVYPLLQNCTIFHQVSRLDGNPSGERHGFRKWILGLPSASPSMASIIDMISCKMMGFKASLRPSAVTAFKSIFSSAKELSWFDHNAYSITMAEVFDEDLFTERMELRWAIGLANKEKVQWMEGC